MLANQHLQKKKLHWPEINLKSLLQQVIYPLKDIYPQSGNTSIEFILSF